MDPCAAHRRLIDGCKNRFIFDTTYVQMRRYGTEWHAFSIVAPLSANPQAPSVCLSDRSAPSTERLFHAKAMPWRFFRHLLAEKN